MNTRRNDLPSDSEGTTSTSDAQPQVEYRGTGVFWVLVALFVPLVVLIVMLAQNAEPVGFEFLWWDASPPLFVVILAAAAAGAALTEGIAAAWRRRRRRTRSEHMELERLRSNRPAA